MVYYIIIPSAENMGDSLIPGNYLLPLGSLVNWARTLGFGAETARRDETMVTEDDQSPPIIDGGDQAGPLACYGSTTDPDECAPRGENPASTGEAKNEMMTALRGLTERVEKMSMHGVPRALQVRAERIRSHRGRAYQLFACRGA